MTDDINRILAAAKALAAEHRHGFVGTEHMLAALLAEPTSPAATLFAGAGLDVSQIRQDLLVGLRQAAEGDLVEPALSRFAERVVETARGEATRDGRESIEDRDLLRPLLAQPKGRLAQLLRGDGEAPAALRAALGLPEPTQPAEAPLSGPAAAAHPAKQPREPREPRPPREPREKKPREESRPEVTVEPKRDRAERSKRDAPSREDGRRTPALRPENRPERGGREAAAPAPPAAAPRRIARPSRSVRFRPSQLLLLALPVSLGLWYSGASPLATFVAGTVAVATFAALAGYAVEGLIDRAGPTIGAVLHGLLGNVAALVVAIVALAAGVVDLARASVVGAIVVSVLLVPALGALAAGDGAAPRLNRSVASIGGGTLALALVGLAVPTLFVWLVGTADRAPADPSPAVAGVLIALYGLAIWSAYRTKQPVLGRGLHSVAAPAWGPGAAVGLLVIGAGGVTVAASLVVSLVPSLVAQGLPFELIALVILPVVTAAAERAPVLLGHGRGRVDLAVQAGLAAGTQGALVLGPVAVIVAAWLGSGMSLVLGGYELFGLLLSGATLLVLSLDDEVGWLRGVQMAALYVLMAVAALFI